NNGEDPDTVLAAPATRWLQDGDVLVPPHATMPAQVFIDDGQQWAVPIGMSILEGTDSDLDPHYLAACINASFNEAANLGAPIPRRDFKHIEVPALDPQGQQEAVNALARRKHRQQAEDALSRESTATSYAFLIVVRYGRSTHYGPRPLTVQSFEPFACHVVWLRQSWKDEQLGLTDHAGHGPPCPCQRLTDNER